MIDFDTSRYPTSVRSWQALLAAVEGASCTDETEWIEFKAHLDPTNRTERPVLAKAIVAFANREVGRAAQHLEGRAVIVVGLEPGNLVGAPVIDPAVLDDYIAPFLASPPPEWACQYVTYRETPVLVITVAPPGPGDRIHTIGANGDKVQDGDVYIRRLGKSVRASSADIAMLSARLGTSKIDRWAVEVGVDVGTEVARFDRLDNWADQWIAAERRRLLEPLIPKDPRQSLYGFDNKLYDRYAGIAELADHVHPWKVKHEETRSQAEYEEEVELYLTGCRTRLPRAEFALRQDLSDPVAFRVRNPTDRNLHSLVVNIHLEGDVTAHQSVRRFTGVRGHLPKAPRIWGPWTETRTPDRLGLSERPMLVRQHSATSSPTLPSSGPTIINGGSADIRFSAIDLRPHAHENLHEGIVVVAGHGVREPVTCTWTATATNVDGRASGTFTIPVSDDHVDLNDYLWHGSTSTPRDRPSGPTIIGPDGFDL